jgi:cbb3-type cytochrome oxidase subunit 3
MGILWNCSWIVGDTMLDQLAETWWLILGVVLFVGIILFVYRRGAKKEYDEDGKIPLDND